MIGRGCLLGIDYGHVRVGLAVSDPERHIAFPLTIYTRKDRAQDARYFREVAQVQSAVQLVIGLPVHLNGQEGQKATEARAFGVWLEEITGLPVTFWDERFTTVEAEGYLLEAGFTRKRRQARRDKVAAQVLLQSYLDAGCPPESILGPLEA